VVRLRERLRWYDGRPLFGRRVLLSRSRLGRSALKRLLQADGAEVVELPVAAMVESVPAQLMERMGDALADGQYGWLIFHSPRAVEFFFRQVHDQGRDSRALHASRVVAAGLGTLEALRAYGIRPDVQVEDASPATILEEMTRQGVSRRRVLLPRVEESHQELLDGLRRAGSEVEDMPMFSRAVPRQPDREVAGQLVRGEFDAVVLPAPTAVRNLLRALGGRTEQLAGLPVACLGASTALVARERGLTVAVVADPPTPEALVRLLGEQFQHAGLTAARG
jgi:uroporphyrinogen III methyltransferase/synthase